MIKLSTKGTFKNTDNFLKRMKGMDYKRLLDKYGREGVKALEVATPKDTGETASSWTYTVTKSNGVYKLTWENSNVVDGTPIAILIQYGHGTNGGGYVQGIDYINPALKPIFEKLADSAWKEVVKR